MGCQFWKQNTSINLVSIILPGRLLVDEADANLRLVSCRGIRELAAQADFEPTEGSALYRLIDRRASQQEGNHTNKLPRLTLFPQQCDAAPPAAAAVVVVYERSFRSNIHLLSSVNNRESSPSRGLTDMPRVRVISSRKILFCSVLNGLTLISFYSGFLPHNLTECR